MFLPTLFARAREGVVAQEPKAPAGSPCRSPLVVLTESWSNTLHRPKNIRSTVALVFSPGLVVDDVRMSSERAAGQLRPIVGPSYGWT